MQVLHPRPFRSTYFTHVASYPRNIANGLNIPRSCFTHVDSRSDFTYSIATPQHHVTSLPHSMVSAPT